MEYLCKFNIIKIGTNVHKEAAQVRSPKKLLRTRPRAFHGAGKSEIEIFN